MELLNQIELKTIGIDYSLYMESFIQLVENPDSNNFEEMKHYENRKLNLHRTQKWAKTFIPSEELSRTISFINKPQIWMVITESWCGDSAQSLPIIAKAVGLNNKISLRIVLRDEHPEIMDLYLTNGSRSIPKLVVFDDSGNELFQWGPRPAYAQNLVKQLKDKGLDKSEINKQLHLWYAKNQGAELDKELSALIKKSTLI